MLNDMPKLTITNCNKDANYHNLSRTSIIAIKNNFVAKKFRYLSIL